MIKSLIFASQLFLSEPKNIKIDSVYFLTDSRIEQNISIVQFPIDDFTVSSGQATDFNIWNSGNVPTSTKNVWISDGHTVTNGTVLNVKNLELGVGSTLILQAGQTLKIGF